MYISFIAVVDKCAIGQILCPENADCIEDSSGNFSCVCHSGFSGDDCSEIPHITHKSLGIIPLHFS